MYPYRDYKTSEKVETENGFIVKVIFYEGQFEDVEVTEYDPTTDTETARVVSQYVRKNRTGSMTYNFPRGTTDEEITRTINGTFNSDTERTSIWG